MSTAGGPGDPGTPPPEDPPTSGYPYPGDPATRAPEQAPAVAPEPAPASLRGAYISQHLRALSSGRLGTNRTLIAFGVGFGAAIGIGVAIIALVAPSTQPLCQPYVPCGPPTKLERPLLDETLWRSPQFGYTLEYPANDLSITQRFADGLTLSGKDPSSGNSILVVIRAAPSGQVSPSQGVTNLLGTINGVTQIAADSDEAHRILGAEIGHRAGAGGAYVGTFTAPQGASSEANLASEAATDGRVTISMIAIGASSDTGPHTLLYGDAESIVNSIQWAS